jgi:hypothetical protein
MMTLQNNAYRNHSGEDMLHCTSARRGVDYRYAQDSGLIIVGVPASDVVVEFVLINIWAQLPPFMVTATLGFCLVFGMTIRTALSPC